MFTQEIIIYRQPTMQCNSSLPSDASRCGCVGVWVCGCVYVYKCVYVYTRIRMYVYACIFIYTQHTYMYIHTYTHKHTYTCTYIYTYIHTYIHTYIFTVELHLCLCLYTGMTSTRGMRAALLVTDKPCTKMN
jgi:hypothetical protein